MKVLFLDIDGVLNSERSRIALGGYPHNFSDADMVKFDHVAIALVRKLCRDTRAKVVLSTSWRYEFRADVTGEALDLPVIGSTPTSTYFSARGDEIAAWLAAHPEVEAYAIVDDIEPPLPEQEPFYVKTDPDVGLTLADYHRLSAILS